MSNKPDAFSKLNPIVQRWIHQQGWANLRSIQEKSVEPIYNRQDVIISAPTASGKTEAAFLPVLSQVAEIEEGISVLYLAPLKALINDQYTRLELLCQQLDTELTRWHGDASQSQKQRQKRTPSGVILITPESLEALLMRDMTWAAAAFINLSYVIIDEFHSFLGNERGMQLQSLLARLELLQQKKIPRIALSATFSDTRIISQALRPHASATPVIVQDEASGGDIKLQLRGYLKTPDGKDLSRRDSDIYRQLRGNNNLIFANSRNQTEQLTANLADLCEKSHVPNEFFAHHGSLSKDHRNYIEKRLKAAKLPTTVCATSTLEMGIDIGDVASIAQVGCPFSVASLRQRLGRSGRRGQAAVMRLFIDEPELTAEQKGPDLLCWRTTQSIAAVNLLLEKWYESPVTEAYQLSTLLQQVLAVVSQYGGVRAEQLYQLLCSAGPFTNVSIAMFSELLHALGDQDLLTQMQDGQLVLGAEGETLTNHYTFYAAFATPEEYRLQSGGKTIGQMPISSPLVNGQHIIFAGRRWQVLEVNMEDKVVLLGKAVGGAPPHFEGNPGLVARELRQEMKRLYLSVEQPIYLDAVARTNFERGCRNFRKANLHQQDYFEHAGNVYMAPWISDRGLFALEAMLREQSLSVSSAAPFIEIDDASVFTLKKGLARVVAGDKPDRTRLADNVADVTREKYDHLLPSDLRKQNYASAMFDVDEAWEYITNISF